MNELRLLAREQRLSLLLAQGAAVATIDELRRLTAEHPYREPLWCLLALALHRCGRRSDAVFAVRLACDVIRDECGVEPGHDLLRLEAECHRDGAFDLPVPRAELLPHAHADAPPDPFVGRETVMGELGRLADDAESGTPRLVVLTGEAGVGKTRLLGVAAQALDWQGWSVLSASCVEGAPALDPWRQLLRRNDPPGEGPCAPDGPLAPLLADEPVREARTEGAREAMFAAVTGHLESLAAIHPLMVVLDDLHWADQTTVELLRHVHLTARGPILLVAGALPPVPASLGGSRVALRGLGADSVAAMLVAMNAPAGRATIDRIALGTGGNPYYARQVLRLVTGGAGEGEAVTHALAEGTAGAVRRCLARLPAPVRMTLVTAAILVTDLDPVLLAQVGGQPEAEVREALDLAVVTGVLIAEPGSGLRFAHDLIRETLLTDLPALERARLHRCALHTLESRNSTPPRPMTPHVLPVHPTPSSGPSPSPSFGPSVSPSPTLSLNPSLNPRSGPSPNPSPSLNPTSGPGPGPGDGPIEPPPSVFSSVFSSIEPYPVAPRASAAAPVPPPAVSPAVLARHAYAALPPASAGGSADTARAARSLATRWGVAAAREAEARLAYGDAARWWARAAETATGTDRPEMQLARIRAHRDAGDHEAARAARTDALRLSGEARDPMLTAQLLTSLDVPEPWTRPPNAATDPAFPGQLAEALAALPKGDFPARCRLLANLATELGLTPDDPSENSHDHRADGEPEGPSGGRGYGSSSGGGGGWPDGGGRAYDALMGGRPAGAIGGSPGGRADALAVEAEGMARRIGDERLLASVLYGRLRLAVLAGREAEIGRLARELIDLSDGAGLPGYGLAARLAVIPSHAEVFDLEGADRRAAECAELLPRTTVPGAEFLHRIWRSTRSILAGEMGSIPFSAADAAGPHVFGAELVAAAHRFVAGRGDLERLPPELLRALSERGTSPAERNWGRLSLTCFRAAEQVRHGDAEAAGRTYTELLPYAGLLATGRGLLPAGPVGYHLGRLAVVCGRHDEARSHLKDALDRSAQAGLAAWEGRASSALESI
ncbi:hypothetical protein Misp01_00010 [Microtetraspora sp. NBRC 13810]|nr:hypothetical protein Misp01_00010 [Microtetraspora sp. NBRC 13810]